jgi:hypothetical protein
MGKMKIIKVAELHDGRLAVYPATAEPIYEYIYREAAGVYWSGDLGCFHSTLPKDWSHQQWYEQIVTVVWSGLKIKLDLTPDTQYEGTPGNFKTDIVSANAVAQKWIHDHENK